VDNSEIIHTLWIGDHLSAMEQLTLSSFHHFGFEVYLWTYSKTLTAPLGITIKDASEIIPNESIFSYHNSNKYGHGKGSLSGFSDIFRYKLLYLHGGIWVDMDVTCLQRFTISTPYFFRFHKQIGLVGNILKSPPGSPLMDWCYQQAISTVTADNTNWLLPIQILKEGVYTFNLEGYIQDVSNADSFPVVRNLYLNSQTPANNWWVIHWMNEEFRRMGIDKNKTVKNSCYHIMLEKHQVEHQIINKREEYHLRWNTSGLHYSLLNIRARYHWYKKLLRSKLLK